VVRQTCLVRQIRLGTRRHLVRQWQRRRRFSWSIWSKTTWAVSDSAVRDAGAAFTSLELSSRGRANTTPRLSDTTDKPLNFLMFVTFLSSVFLATDGWFYKF
jgi:hypothetical protein